MLRSLRYKARLQRKQLGNKGTGEYLRDELQRKWIDTSSTEILKDTLGPNQRKGGAAKNKSKLFSQNNQSVPASPAISGYSSPMPASQKDAEEAKIARKPLIHILALNPLTEVALRDVVVLTKEQLKVALNKVADQNQLTAKWELKRNYWKELDPWTYDFAKPEHRQTVIDNAIRHYDKLRLARSDPEWERLLPKEERGTGKCLSKLQASIALGTIQRTPKINVQKPEGDRTPLRENNQHDLKQHNTSDDNMAKASSQGKKKTKAIPKANPKASSKAVVKPTAKETGPSKSKKVLSAELAISDDEDEDNPPPAQLKPKPKDVATAKVNGIKRSRSDDVNSSDQTPPKKSKKEASKPNGIPQQGKTTEQHPRKVEPSNQGTTVVQKLKKELHPSERTSTLTQNVKPKNKRARGEESTSSSSDVPLSQTIKRTAPPSHRTSDLSQSTVNSSFKSKATTTATDRSPHKSSPLASSPPTNASEIDNVGDCTSSDSDHHIKRHQKSSSITSSTTFSTDSGRRLTNDALMEAKKFKLYYIKYEKLYRELEGRSEFDQKELDNLLDMHERLKELKQKIYAGVVDSRG